MIFSFVLVVFVFCFLLWEVRVICVYSVGVFCSLGVGKGERVVFVEVFG